METQHGKKWMPLIDNMDTPKLTKSAEKNTVLSGLGFEVSNNDDDV